MRVRSVIYGVFVYLNYLGDKYVGDTLAAEEELNHQEELKLNV